ADLAAGQRANRIGEQDVERLFEARDSEFVAVCQAADELRASAVGDTATYVVNRNINYTNICTYGCGFCAFSKGKRNRDGAETLYSLKLEEVGAWFREAGARGAPEVCLRGGIPRIFRGKTYLVIPRAVKKAVPAIHVHAFSPLEVLHGATTLGLSLPAYLSLLR